MYFNKYSAPMNFRYVNNLVFQNRKGQLRVPGSSGAIQFQLLEDDLIRITSTLARTDKRNYSKAGLQYKTAPGVSHTARKSSMSLSCGDVEIRIQAGTAAFEVYHQGRLTLQSTSEPFGVSGAKSIIRLEHPWNSVVYGLGEKTGGLDKSNRSYKMWNVDTVAEYPDAFMKDDFDPTYVAIPFLITRYEKDYYGIYLDNPYASFIHAGYKSGKRGLIAAGEDCESIIALGTEKGLFELYLIPGPSLADVVRRFSRLTGRHELPPLWALGYQQCRWGYKSARELAEVSDRLATAKIPTGAVWMDIDYMDGYRVFSYNPKTFSLKDRRKYFHQIRERGTRLVTIIDPGVKVDPGYSVYDQGIREDVFCKSEEGICFQGYVWPGRSAFPDFSTEKGRRFWARHIQKHLEGGIDGIWLDMNDPSCGPVELDEMGFQDGKVDHGAYHNQYGHLMAQATWEGFRAKDPNQRPFILTRSGYSGTQKYSAIWTGDNCSNEGHLRMSIPMSINLALSGVSFNGPDVGGFAFDTTEDLMVTWMLAGALFPFLRNHSTLGTRPQEPDAFSPRALAILRKCINTRAKLLPYLYNQFFLHWRDGHAVMRPLSYEFKGAAYERVSDQYLIGSSLMVAPFVSLSDKTRSIILPPGWWFSMQSGKWIRGGRTLSVKRTNEMLLFIRDGAILPCLEGVSFYPQPDFSQVSFHVFAKQANARCEYYEDNGLTRDYQKGQYNLYGMEMHRRRNGSTLQINPLHTGYKQGIRSARIYYYGDAPKDTRNTVARWPFGSYPVRGEKAVLRDE